MKFRLLLGGIKEMEATAPGSKDRIFVLMEGRGAAIFDDGRFASKVFTVAFEIDKGKGPLQGESVYTFDDGSSIRVTMTGDLTFGADGPVFKADYAVVGGTGKYEGATGTGNFVSDPTKKYGDGVTYITGGFKITTK